MENHPKHTQKYFYKYVSIDTARLIFESGKFRYTSPLKFNDPFDVQTELYFDFDISDLPHLVANEIDAIVRGKKNVELDENDDWGKGTLLIKEQYKKGNYKRKDLDVLLKPLVKEISSVIEDAKDDCNKHLRKLLKVMKVFCVSEHNQSILMWSHYADYHTGACLKLRVMPEKDNTLCVAQKVEYFSNPPTFFNARKWIDAIVVNQQPDVSFINTRYPVIKSDIWAYEDEWRVWAPMDNGKDYQDINVVEGEIDSIYFGVNASSKDIKEIVSLAKGFGILNFYNSIKKVNEYGMSFVKID